MKQGMAKIPPTRQYFWGLYVGSIFAAPCIQMLLYGFNTYFTQAIFIFQHDQFANAFNPTFLHESYRIKIQLITLLGIDISL